MPLAGQIIRASEDAYADWQPWTSTLGNWTLGSGASSFRTKKIGTDVIWEVDWEYGSGAAIGASPVTFTLPYPPAGRYAASEYFPGMVRILDHGVTARQGELLLLSGSTVQLWYWSSATATATVGTSTPWAWGSTDRIFAYGRYQAAS